MSRLFHKTSDCHLLPRDLFIFTLGGFPFFKFLVFSLWDILLRVSIFILMFLPVLFINLKSISSFVKNRSALYKVVVCVNTLWCLRSRAYLTYQMTGVESSTALSQWFECLLKLINEGLRRGDIFSLNNGFSLPLLPSRICSFSQWH